MGDFAFDVMGVLDAVYTVELDTPAWCERVLDAASRHLGHGAGVGLALYDISAAGELEAATVVGNGASEEWTQVGVESHRDPSLAASIGHGYGHMVLANVQQMLAGNAEFRASYLAAMKRCSIGDQWLINGCNGRSGAALYLFGKAEMRFDGAQQRLLRALARHIATSYRLHQRLAQRPAREDLATQLGIAVLSEREREIAMLATSGRTNKEIAYDLRLADSTVRVLLARAAGKLGARSRVELVNEVGRLSAIDTRAPAFTLPT